MRCPDATHVDSIRPQSTQHVVNTGGSSLDSIGGTEWKDRRKITHGTTRSIRAESASLEEKSDKTSLQTFNGCTDSFGAV